MTTEQIRDKILADIRALGSTQLSYLSGLNHISAVTVEEAENRITARRGASDHISIAFDRLDSIAAGLATGNPVNVDAVFQGSGNARSALETILAHLPNVGFLPANKSPNTGPKKIVWFDEEIHPVGEVLDACELVQNRGPAVVGAVTGAATTKPNEVLHSLVNQFQEDAKAAQLQLDDPIAHRLACSLLSKRFLIATGLAGSGKTKLAQAFARWITPKDEPLDAFVPDARIESDRVIYIVKKADSLAVEFWNADKEEEATKVTLPRAVIEEWSDYISAHALTREASARELRQAVKATSRFSDQLHSFETHLKAAAFALIEARQSRKAAKCYDVIPVGADWTGSENVLGYPNGLNDSEYVTKPSLDLILHAKAHPDDPHFLILDEMNLSHVERYFADILSVIESEEKIHLHLDRERKANGKEIAAEVELPKNLFIIGTVNVDETTYMFSPKVLDRANVIEFRMEATELESFLVDPAKPNLADVDGKGYADFGKSFVDSAKGAVAVPTDAKATYDAEMILFFKALQGHGAEFGYRVAHESARFVHFYKLLGNCLDDGTWFPSAFDCVVVQKFLPKLHGSRTKLGPLLKALWFLCVTPHKVDAEPKEERDKLIGTKLMFAEESKAEPNKEIPNDAPYPISAEKIVRMWRLLKDNGFASFAEA